MKTLAALNTIGPFISGLSLAFGACAAWATVFVVNRRTLYMTWLDGFRTLYAEFWQNENMARVRTWICSDIEYGKLKDILTERLKTTDNLLDAEANEMLEYVDQFCALLVRIEFFDKTMMTTDQRDLWHKTYGDFWINKNQRTDRVAAIYRKILARSYPKNLLTKEEARYRPAAEPVSAASVAQIVQERESSHTQRATA